MFSGLSNQMSSWMGKKQEGVGLEAAPKSDEDLVTPVRHASEEGEAEQKKDSSPTKGSSRLEVLGNLGGSVKSQMSSWLGGGLPGLRRAGGGGADQGGGGGAHPAEEQLAPEAGADPGAQLPPLTPAAREKDDDDSSDTGGADSDAHLSEGSGSPVQDKDSAQAFGSVSTKAIAGAKSIGNFLYTAVNKAGKTVSEAGAKIKKTVEENSLLGEFNKEHEAFLKEKQANKGDGAAVPPWVGHANEEALKEECLSLSTDRRNFVRAPPAGVDFQFDLDIQYPIALATLAEDPNLEKMRFELVPKIITEENFWRNYFYRVSLICQANDVSSMAKEGGTSLDHTDAEPAAAVQKPVRAVGSGSEDTSASRGLAEEHSPQHEFVSDTFTASTEDIEEVKQGMRKLGITTAQAEEEWEKELDAELQDFEMVGGTSDSDKNFDQQIENELADLK